MSHPANDQILEDLHEDLKDLKAVLKRLRNYGEGLELLNSWTFCCLTEMFQTYDHYALIYRMEHENLS